MIGGQIKVRSVTHREMRNEVKWAGDMIGGQIKVRIVTHREMRNEVKWAGDMMGGANKSKDLYTLGDA